MVVSLGLDLGTTRIKLLALGKSSQVEAVWSTHAPTWFRDGIECTTDPRAYAAQAEALIQDAAVHRDIPLGISCQRSSFLMWDKVSGDPCTPLISWQDMRARDWCGSRRNLASTIWKKTGLPLAPNYAGPKMRVLLDSDTVLKKHVQRGSVLLGTLESYLLWRWTGGHHRTDLSMAARTLMVSLGNRRWDPQLTQLFGVSIDSLPSIEESWRFRLDWRSGHPITACLADQTGGAIPIFADQAGAMVINAGTGTFVMRAMNRRAPKGILTALTGPLPAIDAEILWEGPINAGSRILNRENGLRPQDAGHKSDVFALPDEGIVAAPFWRPVRYRHASMPQTQTSDHENTAKHQAAFEGLLFRICQVVDVMRDDRRPTAIILSGGLSAHRIFVAALASTLNRDIEILEHRELSALGAAWLAIGATEKPLLKTTTVQPRAEWRYLKAKYIRWKAWIEQGQWA